MEGTGAVGVDGGLPTFYNAIQTGVADGVLISYSGGVPFKLYEVAPFVTRVGLGAQYTGGISINKDTWDTLPPELQTLLSELGGEYSRVHTEQLANQLAAWEKLMLDGGATITDLPLDERKKWAAGLPDLGGVWLEAATARGLPAQELLTAYMDGVRAFGGTPLRDWDR